MGTPKKKVVSNSYDPYTQESSINVVVTICLTIVVMKV